MTRGFFVTGTDTGVGKTLVACALVGLLRRANIDVGVMKPVETGVTEAGPLDAKALANAADCSDSLADVCPLRYALPAAPNVAARAENLPVDLQRIHDAYDRIASKHQVMVVEGAGGLLVPLTDQKTMGEIAADLGLPLIVVARGALGTINHTLLTLDSARNRGLEVAGVIISHGPRQLTAPDAANLHFLRQHLGPRLLGEIPPLVASTETQRVLDVPSDALDRDAILKLLDAPRQ